MARELRKSKAIRFNSIDGLLRHIFSGTFATERRSMDGVADLQIDHIFTLWHECRRAKEQILAAGDISELNSMAQDLYGDNAFDLTAMAAAAVVELNAIQAEIGVNILDLSPQGVVRTSYCRCTDNPPFFNPVTPAEYAQTAVLLDQLRVAITIAVP